MPEAPIITLPNNIWESFRDNAGGAYIGRGSGINGYEELYETEGVFDGDLRFTFDSEFEITIPNEQLVFPQVIVNLNGSQTTNDLVRSISINSIPANDNSVFPILGQTFLTSAYLYVNGDLDEFPLWQANPTLEEQIIPVGDSSQCTGAPIIASGPTSPTQNRIPFQHTDQPNGDIRPMVVAGVVIGGLFVLAIVGCILCCLCRKKSQRRERMVNAAGRAELQRTILHKSSEFPLFARVLELPDSGALDDERDRLHEADALQIYEMEGGIWNELEGGIWNELEG
ncbi:hypothetical protein MMC25_004363 [Agyrium rufum]|nr:hypothetical protein [Agyrium rufum]